MIPLKLASVAPAIGRVIGLLLAAGFHIAWLSQPLGWPLLAFHVSFVVLAVARPKDALLVFAGLAPLTTSLSVLFQSPRPGWCLLMAMLWAVTTGLLARRTAPPVHLRLRTPATLLAVVTVGSAIVTIAGHPSFIVGYTDVRSAASALMGGEWFEWTWPWIPLHVALATALGLFTAVETEQVIRSNREFGFRLIRTLVAGHAGAIAISLSRIGSAALREENVLSAWSRLLADIRYYSEYDINAAGSTLVIVACAGLGLIAVRRQALTSIAVLFVLAGVWLTGSRAAIVAFIGVLVAKPVVGGLVDGGRRNWFRAAAAITGVVTIALALYAYYPQERNVATSVAFDSRLVMMRTAWRAGLSDPLFGIGIGSLPERGVDFGSSEMVRFMGPAGLRENAHNQYLQVFAETGLLGLAALALLLGSLGWSALWTAADDRLRSWLAWGLVGSLMTWLLGHPLLVLEAAVIFWLFVGIAAGLRSAPARAPAWSPSRVLGVALATLVVVVTPLRAARAPRLALLEHHAIGVSDVWHHDDAFPYRVASARFSLFLPSSRVVAVPLRAAEPAADSIEIAIHLRGQLINRVEVSSRAWRQLRIVLPESDQRFERVDFVVVRSTDDALEGIVRVGKTIDLGRFPTSR